MNPLNFSSSITRILIFKSVLLVFFSTFFGNISAQAQSPDLYEISVKHFGTGHVPQNAVALPLMEITIQANENIELSEIWLSRSGLSSWNDFGNVWSITENYARSSRGRVRSDDTALIKFRRPVKIKKGAQETFKVYINLNLKGAGRSFEFQIDRIVVDGVTENQTSKYGRSYRRNFRVSSQYAVPVLELSPLGNKRHIKIGRTAEVGKFRFHNPSRKSIQLQSIRFKNYGKSDLSIDFENWELRSDDQVLSSEIESSDDFINFVLDNYTLEAGKSIIVKISAQLMYARRNHTIQLGIQYPGDVMANIRNTDVNVLTKIDSKKLKKHTLGIGNFRFIRSYLK